MKKIILFLTVFFITFSVIAQKEIGFTITVKYNDGESLIDYVYDVAKVGDAQDIINIIYPNTYTELYTELEKSNYFEIKTSDSFFSIERKKVIPKKIKHRNSKYENITVEKKFKKIKNSEKKLYYNKF